MVCFYILDHTSLKFDIFCLVYCKYRMCSRIFSYAYNDHIVSTSLILLCLSWPALKPHQQRQDFLFLAPLLRNCQPTYQSNSFNDKVNYFQMEKSHQLEIFLMKKKEFFHWRMMMYCQINFYMVSFYFCMIFISFRIIFPIFML